MVRGITERDHALFQKLGDYGVLSTGQLRELFFKNIRKTTMLRRLRALERRYLIRRIQGLSDGSHGWSLTKRCAYKLGTEGVFKNINRNSLQHDVTLSQVRMALQSVGLGETWVPEHVLRFRAWQERNQNKKVSENIPDGIFTVESGGDYLAVAIELELNEKNSDRYAKTLGSYWGKQSLAMIWYLVPTRALGEKIERLWKKTNGTSNTRLKWSIISQVLKNPYDIELHCLGTTRLLRNVITLRQPAHTTAHTVSTIANSNLNSITETNSATA